ncbi:hypothetical protein LL912_19840 [Niabella sp. CC-SYL272]|uniref:hypothetical protein n=1 Tax=Niabella agricola TaxID=2891571 RepID=UPI001F3C0E4D|nr:hypothetical protein [Niabella agricola]MCF3111049.1 hypothetical protein [Niabella agricola]
MPFSIFSFSYGNTQFSATASGSSSSGLFKTPAKVGKIIKIIERCGMTQSPLIGRAIVFMAAVLRLSAVADHSLQHLNTGQLIVLDLGYWWKMESALSAFYPAPPAKTYAGGGFFFGSPPGQVGVHTCRPLATKVLKHLAHLQASCARVLGRLGLHFAPTAEVFAAVV